ncbi:MFS transporter [Acetobacteraceae bacterium KSS8]|uniref:MFS transporter n=1 Tax=Endosaccharibacter trunci TaxID=2812733 RepID=A0ABT1W3L3_9PROT|nr:MFS transporter [Acetobacteraceae bacterium KSS8]
MQSGIHKDGLPAGLRFWGMLAILLGTIMAVLDASVANIALPTIARELKATPAEAVWVVNAYQLVLVATILPLASLGEKIGYRRVYGAGLGLFVAGSLFCALSGSLPLLVAARLVQGLGAAGLMSVSGALVRHVWPLALLGRGVGLLALVVSLAAAVGPSVAASVLAIANWEWLFAVNVPIGLANLWLARRFLPLSELSGGPLDRIGAVSNMLCFGLFFVGIDMLTHGGGALWTGGLVLAVAIGVGAFGIRRAARLERPLMPVDLMRIPVFALSICASICAFGAYALAFLALPFRFEDGLHMGQVQTGLLMTAWPAAIAVIAPIAGRLTERIAPALLGGVGMGVLAAGFVLLALLPATAAPLAIAWRMMICGAGFGLFQAPNNRVMLGTAPRNRAGAAGGMLATARLFGQTSGATLAAIGFRVLPQGGERIEMLACAALSVLAGLFSVGRFRRGK